MASWMSSCTAALCKVGLWIPIQCIGLEISKKWLLNVNVFYLSIQLGNLQLLFFTAGTSGTAATVSLFVCFGCLFCLHNWVHHSSQNCQAHLQPVQNLQTCYYCLHCLFHQVDLPLHMPGTTFPNVLMFPFAKPSQNCLKDSMLLR